MRLLRLGVFGCALALCASGPVQVAARRVANQPLLAPDLTRSNLSWARAGLFNPAAIRTKDKVALLFRAQDAHHTSRIGFAESEDGLHFTVRPQPLLSPETAYERGGGLEDPRLVFIGGSYYLTYTGYNLHDAQLCLATSRDLQNWERHGVILPAYKGTWNKQWTKSGAIVSQKINGEWWMYYLGTKIDSDGKARDYMGLAASNDLLHWTDATQHPVLERRPGAFDERVMEPGPPPILTDRGILLLYNGANESLVYRPGWALFDRHDPRRLIARCAQPFAAPTLSWERAGTVPNVIFLEGLVDEAPPTPNQFRLLGYYGAADTRIGAFHLTISMTR